jgi:hypothetical protein
MAVRLQINKLATCNSNSIINIIGQNKLLKNIFPFPFEPDKDIKIFTPHTNFIYIGMYKIFSKKSRMEFPYIAHLFMV